MPGYTKLFNSIITSTLWLEPDHTRLVWITMLALADKNGEVQASVPGLAKMAGVPVEACRSALECLSSPDPDSRSKEVEGRRIVEIEGGWELINHSKYRRMASEEDARENNARRQARHRERNDGVTHSNGTSRKGSGEVTPYDHKQKQSKQSKQRAEAKENAEASNTSSAEPRGDAFDSFWTAYPKKVGKLDAQKAWKLKKCNVIAERIMAKLAEMAKSWDWTKDGGQYVPNPATWLNRGGWEDEAGPAAMGKVNGVSVDHTAQGKFGI